MKAHTEGYSYVLIDVATGTSAEIGDIPRFSPNASQFVLVGTATGADWAFGKIQIWRMDSDAIEKEFDWEYGDPFDGTKSSTVWQLDFKEWSSEDRVLLNAGAVDNSSLGPHQSTIVKSAGSWKILMPSPSS